MLVSVIFKVFLDEAFKLNFSELIKNLLKFSSCKYSLYMQHIIFEGLPYRRQFRLGYLILNVYNSVQREQILVI